MGSVYATRQQQGAIQTTSCVDVYASPVRSKIGITEGRRATISKDRFYDNCRFELLFTFVCPLSALMGYSVMVSAMGFDLIRLGSTPSTLTNMGS